MQLCMVNSFQNENNGEHAIILIWVCSIVYVCPYYYCKLSLSYIAKTSNTSSRHVRSEQVK